MATKHTVVFRDCTDVQRTMLTQGIVCTAIILVFKMLALLAKLYHDRIVAKLKDDKEGFENTKRATTSSVLKPLSVMLPILGWLIAFQRLVTGEGRTYLTIMTSKMNIFGCSFAHVMNCGGPEDTCYCNCTEHL